MEEFIKTIERFLGIIVGLVVLYIVLSNILRIDNATYLRITRDVLTSYAFKW